MYVLCVWSGMSSSVASWWLPWKIGIVVYLDIKMIIAKKTTIASLFLFNVLCYFSHIFIKKFKYTYWEQNIFNKPIGSKISLTNLTQCLPFKRQKLHEIHILKMDLWENSLSKKTPETLQNLIIWRVQESVYEIPCGICIHKTLKSNAFPPQHARPGEYKDISILSWESSLGTDSEILVFWAEC